MCYERLPRLQYEVLFSGQDVPLSADVQDRDHMRLFKNSKYALNAIRTNKKFMNIEKK